ncbi:(d)CMP kinase [Methylorubrum rhodesianum]|jgi:cytidylate kinase|uniref:Cytidylate kinase n=1 Tax=Methylorubrum rhodesianum TaxID=29427 RepID=A0ABU9ZB95_9HYPH|nr:MULTISPECIES: (d)CMP kinase [Methylorubrum]MBY0142068.1 (d)CMP kinase [Methylorubrum populi]MRI56687.1 (d)CMP kinase [Methylobacterium sp. DB1607]MBB5764945.1 cytidylate kinase [Methylorubrum rhodesianum]MBI1690838.1 (d)CMP kinase [Methylorubrum sp. DB1722]MBK3401474.1 (d)CMP kinase [Methylorubrum rhodesianum]
MISDDSAVQRNGPLVIAIDGPAASGKGTLAKRLALHYGLPHLDTGLLYRAVALTLIDEGTDLDDTAAAARAASALSAERLSDPRLRERAMGEAASRVSSVPEVRAALLSWQRRFAEGAEGAVLDGRDIGTVVCPEARVKLFIIAAPEERARRRHRELLGRGEETTLAAILADIRARDARDSSRAAAPLKAAEDAVVLDTTELDAEAAFAEAVAIVERLKAA